VHACPGAEGKPGSAWKDYYGDIAGKTLSVLLRDHIQAATEVVAAAKSGDQAKLTEAQKKWSANGKEINRGRDAHCWAPPAQIPACPIRAPGSYLG